MYKKAFIALFVTSLFILKQLPVFAQESKELEELKKLDLNTAKEIEEKYNAESKYGAGVYTLRGLKETGVLIEELPNFAIEDGLTEQQLETDVELRLRLAGIKVVPLDEILKIPGTPYLYININLSKSNELGYYDIDVNASLRQQVVLTRNPLVKVFASTWNVSVVTGASTSRMPNHVRNSLKGRLDRFLNAYLAMNPKEGVNEQMSK